MGFGFVWAVDGKVTQQEISWNHLTGDALIFGKNVGFSYLAYPQQALSITGDRVLNLDGFEYCAGPSTILVQGFAAGVVKGLMGTLVVAALDIDFIQSTQPEFDINVSVYNQDETYHSRHLHSYQFGVFDLANDLQLSISQIFHAKVAAHSHRHAGENTHPGWRSSPADVGGVLPVRWRAELG